MEKLKEVKLSNEEKDLLFDVLVSQKYAIELVGSEIADIEKGNKPADEVHLKKLNDLYNRLLKSGI